MFPLSVCCVIIAIFSSAAGFPWGTSDCGPPTGHSGGSSSDATGLSIVMDGSKVILSSSRGAFKGFYMQSDQNLVWVDPPAGSLLAHLAPPHGPTPRLIRAQVPLAAAFAMALPTPSSSTPIQTPSPLYLQTSPAHRARPFPSPPMSFSRFLRPTFPSHLR